MTIEREDAERSRILQSEMDAMVESMVLRDTRDRYVCSEPGHYEEGSETHLASSASHAAELHAGWLWNRFVRYEYVRIAVVDANGVRTDYGVTVAVTPTFSAVPVESEVAE